MITSTDAEWVPLVAVYNHVFALERTPEAAKRDIITELHTVRLRHRVERTLIYSQRLHLSRSIKGLNDPRDAFRRGTYAWAKSAAHGGIRTGPEQPVPREMFKGA